VHSYTLRGKPPQDELPEISPEQIKELQGKFMEAGHAIGTPSQPDGKDGKIGWLTFGAMKHVAKEAGVNLRDVDFRSKNDAHDKFMNSLNTHIVKHEETIKILAEPLKIEPLPKIVDAGAGIPASIRNTRFDPRYLATVSDQELNNILKDGLHGVGKIAGGVLGSYHRNGKLGDVTTAKVKEQQRELLGLQRGEESFDRATLEKVAAAMGQEVAKRDPYALTLVPVNKTIQAAADVSASSAAAGFSPSTSARTATAERQGPEV
jgi:hypothetical protein